MESATSCRAASTPCRPNSPFALSFFRGPPLHREGQAIVTHGYTQLRLGDKVTVMGSPESLREVELKFAAPGTGRSA